MKVSKCRTFPDARFSGETGPKRTRESVCGTCMRHISNQFSLQRVAVIESGLPQRCLAVSVGKSGKKIRPLPFLSVLAHVSRSFGADASSIQGSMDPHAYTALPIAAARAISTERNGGIQVLHVNTASYMCFRAPKKSSASHRSTCSILSSPPCCKTLLCLPQ